jgi:N-sulfoglucosamine sulfohydrolase
MFMKNSITSIGLVSFAGLAACIDGGQDNGQKNKPESPNVVLIVSDDHGTHDLGCYGNPVIHTPNLDKLADKGIRFTNAYCTSASSSASRSVILTGLYNHGNGHYGHQHRFHNFKAFDNLKSLPVLLEKEAGYKTARIGKYHVAPEKVFHFQEVLDERSSNPVAMADACLPFIKRNKDNPFFLYYCTSDPHRGGGVVESNPYKPDRFHNKDQGYQGVEPVTFHPDSVIVPYYLPDNEATRAELAQYYQSVARFDQGVGQLIKHLQETGTYKNTLIIYISDNGIAFPGAKTNVYQPGVKLPCIIKNPGGENKGTVSDALINWADLAPTILDFAGALEASEKRIRNEYEANKDRWDNTHVPGFHGKSFKEILETGKSSGWDTTYASHTFHEVTMYYPMRTIITRKYKLIWNIAYPLPYPHAKDLWESATWQYALKNKNVTFGGKSTEYMTYRPEFELYDLETDPEESYNLAGKDKYQDILENFKEKIKDFQENTQDPWAIKWKHD